MKGMNSTWLPSFQLAARSFQDTANSPFCKSQWNDWLADQWDKRSVLRYVQFYKGRMKGDDPEIDTAQTPKR